MRKQVLFGLITVVLIMVLAGSISGVVLGMPKRFVDTADNCYMQMEEIYVEQVRTILDEEGLYSAGVTLTYERDSDGSRLYTLLVHHHRLENFKQAELELLTERMEENFFTGNDCSVHAKLSWQLEG